MRLVMAGLDHTTADVTARETFALPDQRLSEVLRTIRAADGVDGCVLLSTCNRSELYLSYGDGGTPDGVELLCRALGTSSLEHRPHFIERHERQAATHLFQVTSGLRSSVLGDSQIVTQVRNAIEAAREAGTADPLLETLFRSAVTAGKRVKSSVSFVREGGSVAAEAVRRIQRKLVSLIGRNALIIGNGVVGRLATAELLARGCRVTVALRNRNERRLEVPEDCDSVEYADRFHVMKRHDIVVSATASPRLTVELKDVSELERPPCVFADLAVPRDIDPALASLPGVTLWNVDDLKQNDAEDENASRLLMAEDILEDEARRFEMWRQNRKRRLAGQAGAPDFPIFINLHGAGVLIAGGGRVAARRAGVLLNAGAQVQVVSPRLSPEMERHLGRPGLTWARRGYRTEDIEGMTLAVAATDDRETNRKVGEDARERGILASVADRREECGFYFPAVIQSDLLTAGLVSRNGDHTMVRKAAAKIREELERVDEDHTGGIEGERTGGGAGASGHRCDTAFTP